MKAFIVKLSDEERAQLESHRERLGLRSMAAVVRHWIETEGPYKAREAAILDRAAQQVADSLISEQMARQVDYTKSAPYGVDARTGEPLPKPAPMQKKGKAK